MSAAWPCPACGRDNEAHTNVHGLPVQPVRGDVTFCIGCHALLIFEVGPLGALVERLPSPAEYLELLADPHIAAVRDRLDRADGLR